MHVAPIRTRPVAPSSAASIEPHSQLDQQALSRIGRLAARIEEKEARLNALQQKREQSPVVPEGPSRTKQDLDNEIKTLNADLVTARTALRAATDEWEQNRPKLEKVQAELAKKRERLAQLQAAPAGSSASSATRSESGMRTSLRSQLEQSRIPAQTSAADDIAGRIATIDGEIQSASQERDRLREIARELQGKRQSVKRKDKQLAGPIRLSSSTTSPRRELVELVNNPESRIREWGRQAGVACLLANKDEQDKKLIFEQCADTLTHQIDVRGTPVRLVKSDLRDADPSWTFRTCITLSHLVHPGYAAPVLKEIYQQKIRLDNLKVPVTEEEYAAYQDNPNFSFSTLPPTSRARQITEKAHHDMRAALGNRLLEMKEKINEDHEKFVYAKAKNKAKCEWSGPHVKRRHIDEYLNRLTTLRELTDAHIPNPPKTPGQPYQFSYAQITALMEEMDGFNRLVEHCTCEADGRATAEEERARKLAEIADNLKTANEKKQSVDETKSSLDAQVAANTEALKGQLAKVVALEKEKRTLVASLDALSFKKQAIDHHPVLLSGSADQAQRRATMQDMLRREVKELEGTEADRLQAYTQVDDQRLAAMERVAELEEQIDALKTRTREIGRQIHREVKAQVSGLPQEIGRLKAELATELDNVRHDPDIRQMTSAHGLERVLDRHFNKTEDKLADLAEQWGTRKGSYDSLSQLVACLPEMMADFRRRFPDHYNAASEADFARYAEQEPVRDRICRHAKAVGTGTSPGTDKPRPLATSVYSVVWDRQKSRPVIDHWYPA